MQPYKPRRQDSTKQTTLTDKQLQQGSITGKYPIVIAERKLTVYVSDPSKEHEIREFYSTN